MEKEIIKRKEYRIDAEGKSLGRLASLAASYLRGKNSPAFKPNAAPFVKVKIKNISRAILTGNKMKVKTLKHYTGYPSGLKLAAYEAVFQKKPEECFRKAVERMLQRNRLRKVLLKNLMFE